MVQISSLEGSFLNRLLIVLLLAPAGAIANPITGPVPDISSACALDGSPVACDFSNDDARAIAFTSFTMTGLNTSIGLHIEADAGVEAIGNGSAVASVFLDFFVSTRGPVREGFANYLVLTDTEHGGPLTSFNYLAGISGLGSCEIVFCENQAMMVPFELGIPFEIIVNASLSVGPGPFDENGGIAGGFITSGLNLQLFDASGAPVEIFAVPEPSAWILAAIGFAALFVFRVRATLRGIRML
jgi:hypothetical protein